MLGAWGSHPLPGEPWALGAPAPQRGAAAARGKVRTWRAECGQGAGTKKGLATGGHRRKLPGPAGGMRVTGRGIPGSGNPLADSEAQCLSGTSDPETGPG